jgi:hypothetical protein
MKTKRIYHTWDKWECFPAGFYENSKEGMSKEECEGVYKELLADIPRFKLALNRVILEWTNSCEHYLTNDKMNRVAWLGQASLCIETGIPSVYRSGFFTLTKEQQEEANCAALEYLNIWLAKNNYEQVNMEMAGVNSQANIY